MDFDKLFPGRFIKAADFNGKDCTLTIAGVKVEELQGDKKTETKGIVSFRENPKALVLNKTNGLCLKAMFGRETDAWVGRRVTFYAAHIEFEGNDLAVRVRGSPDIAQDLEFELKLPRKKARTTKLTKTGGAPAANASPPKAPANHAFVMLQDLAKLNQIPWAKVGEWLKARGRPNGASVTAEDVEAYKALLAAEPMPPPEDAPF